MLILSRHPEESIIIDGGTIKIKVIDIRGDKVRLGIESPKDMRVDREEIHLKIAAEQSEGT